MMQATEYYDSAGRKPRAIEELVELFHNGPLIHALVERDVKVRYKRSIFGFLWTLVNPLAMLLVLSLAFTRVFVEHAPAYPFFVIPGLLLWNFMSQTTLTVAREVAMRVDIWRRVRLPKSAQVIATTASGLINLLLALIPLLVVLVLVGRNPGASVFSLPLTIFLAAVFVVGVAMILAAIAVYFPDIADIFSILLPALMFTAPIIYPRAVAMPPLSYLLLLNPLTVYVEAFRAPLYTAAAPGAGDFALMAVVSLATLVAGWIVFTHSTDDVAYQV
jgi:ABC-type polysaccharide/polyol phosphate export permease